MKALITGAGGFIGGTLARLLLAEGGVEQLTLMDLRFATRGTDPRLRYVEGDIRDAAVRDAALAGGVDVLFHLAVVPGGAAEANYALSRAVNVDATLDLLEAASRARQRPRVVFASTIAVFGAPLPALVDDETPMRPAMIYGAHKLMLEIALADFARRSVLDTVAVRLPGIVPRPPAPSGMTSAFMSDIFHALSARRPMTVPVSPQATLWLMSVSQCAKNLHHAATLDSALMPAGRVLTLPAVRTTMADLVGAIASATGADPASVSYEPDASLEPQFGRQPPLVTVAGDRAGFRHDGDVASLVRRGLDDAKAA